MPLKQGVQQWTPNLTRTAGQIVLGLDIRNSTAFQVDNYSAESQADMEQVAKDRHPGAEVIVFDEQGTSGRDLSKRSEILRALDMLKAGTLHGLVVYDVKRLTRDPFGIDGGTIARLLVENHGLLVTHARDYNLRLPDHMMAFQFECLIAGIDLRTIRDTFWRGLLKKAEQTAVFRRPPLGYHTVREWGDRVGTVRKYPAKNPAHADAMVAIAHAFEACDSIQQAAAALTQGNERLGIAPVPRPDGAPHWTMRGLRYILADNPIYYGVFTFGRNFETAHSPVWESTGYGETIRTLVPELAYWPLATITRWRRKFLGTKPSTHSRARKYPHPLTGILRCAQCDRPMVGAGKLGYRCSGTLLSQCDQWVSTGQVLRALDPILDELMLDASEMAAEAVAQASGRKETPAERELMMAEQRVAALRANILALTEPDPELTAAFNEAKGRVKVLQARVADQQGEMEELAALNDLAVLLTTLGWRHVWPSMDADQQQRVCALLIADLRLQGEGRRGGRRWSVLDYQPRLSRISDESHPSFTSYASILDDLAHLLGSRQ